MQSGIRVIRAHPWSGFEPRMTPMGANGWAQMAENQNSRN